MNRTQVRLYTSIGYDLLFNRNSYYILGYTKSGTNWLCSILSTLLEIPVYEPWQANGLAKTKHIYHIHRFLPFKTIENRTCYMLRDGRDAMISRYYAMLNMPDQVAEKLSFARFIGQEPTKAGIRDNLSTWIKFLANNNQSSTDWSSHVKQAIGLFDNIIRFEELRNGATEGLQKVLLDLTGTEFHPNELNQALSLHAFDKAKKASESDYAQSFLRSGVSGEWKQVFNRESAHAFCNYAGEALILTGYEPNDDWVNEFST